MANKYNPDSHHRRSIRLRDYDYTQAGAQNRAIHRIAPTEKPIGPISDSIGAIIGQFKSVVTKNINQIRNTPGVPVWQRNYYEHIIRDEDEMNRIREYITNNPLQWAEDENNPINIVRTFKM